MRYLQFSLIAFISSLFIFTSCNKDEIISFDPVAQFEIEKPIIENYVKANYPNMEYTSDTTTGIWFEVTEPGIENSYEYKLVDTIIGNTQGKTVRPPIITVRYTGKLLNNQTFDSNTSETGFTSKLDQLVLAWYYAFIPTKIGDKFLAGLTEKGLQKGSKIRFVTPSYYAYGNRSAGIIPANSPLYFEIEVTDIK